MRWRRENSRLLRFCRGWSFENRELEVFRTRWDEGSFMREKRILKENGLSFIILQKDKVLWITRR